MVARHGRGDRNLSPRGEEVPDICKTPQWVMAYRVLVETRRLQRLLACQRAVLNCARLFGTGGVALCAE